MTQPRKTTKIETIRQMLSTAEGASLAQICTTTGWQEHSARAALSELRKAGFTLALSTAAEADGQTVYRITAMPPAPEVAP